MRKKIMVLAIAALIIGGLLAGCGDADLPVPEVSPPPVISNETENTPVPDEPQDQNENDDQNEANPTAGTAPGEPDAISGIVEEIQGNEIRIGLIQSTPLEIDGEIVGELVGPPEYQQTILLNESTTFEIMVLARRGGAFIRTEDGTFTDIYLQDNLRVYGQDQGDVFLAEKIVILVFE